MSTHHHGTPGDPAARSEPPAAERPLELTHAQMNLAYDSGEAVPFAQVIPWLARYQDSWWVIYEGGWLRITDPATISDLDQRAAQMTDADTQAARQTAIRDALSSLAGATDTGGDDRDSG